MEPSHVHRVLHTNAGCLGSDQEQKGWALGSITVSSLTSLSASSSAVKAGAATCSCSPRASFLGQAGRKDAVLGTTEGSRAEARREAPSHPLAHSMGLTSALLGAAQPETPPANPPVYPETHTVLKKRGVQGTPKAYRTHQNTPGGPWGVRKRMQSALGNTKRCTERSRDHQKAPGVLWGGLQSKLKGQADGPEGNSTQPGAPGDNERQTEPSGERPWRRQRWREPLKGRERLEGGRSVPKQVGSGGSSSSEAGFARCSAAARGTRGTTGGGRYPSGRNPEAGRRRAPDRSRGAARPPPPPAAGRLRGEAGPRGNRYARRVRAAGGFKPGGAELRAPRLASGRRSRAPIGPLA